MENNENLQKRNVKKTSRYLAMSILERTDKMGSYSNLLINEAIQKNNFKCGRCTLVNRIGIWRIATEINVGFLFSPFFK